MFDTVNPTGPLSAQISDLRPCFFFERPNILQHSSVQTLEMNNTPTVSQLCLEAIPRTHAGLTQAAMTDRFEGAVSAL